MTFGTQSWLFIYEFSSEEKCAVDKASAVRSDATLEWVHGEKKRMRRVEEEAEHSKWEVYTVVVVCMIIHDWDGGRAEWRR